MKPQYRVRIKLLDKDGHSILREGTYVYNSHSEAVSGFDAACDAAAEQEPDDLEEAE